MPRENEGAERLVANAVAAQLQSSLHVHEVPLAVGRGVGAFKVAFEVAPTRGWAGRCTGRQSERFVKTCLCRRHQKRRRPVCACAHRSVTQWIIYNLT